MGPRPFGLQIGDTVASRYVIKSLIGEGGMGAVYRAMPFQDPSHDVAIKIIQRPKALGHDDILRFQKEAALMSLLHHPNIICFHELGIIRREGKSAQAVTSIKQLDESDGYYIVMEIADGKDLKQSLNEDTRKDLPFFFEVGLQVASALDYTHGKNIIHRDIKPQNIVVGKTWQEQKGVLVKVLDFGVARLAELTHSAGNQDKPLFEIAGTPMYMAPEQTPLLDAPIDHRVDLYSLGCVLYEVLAGRPPFVENTRDKLMARHAKATPESLTAIRPDLPRIIEAIVMKLLAKNPMDRYQTAFGLLADLQRARSKLIDRRKGHAHFKLGQKDSFRAVSARLKLVGREMEYQTLKDRYQQVSAANGRSHMVAIKGHAGIGKTRLLTEFRTWLATSKIRFISVSFSRHENNLPYNALANGFNDYLMRLIKDQPQEAEELRRKIRNVLGNIAYLVADRVPGLRPFIDPSLEPNRELLNYDAMPSEEIAAREFQTFAKAFSDFTRCLAIDNQPIVFIMDDMHWADENSLALVDQFFSHNNSQRFYLVLSYRAFGHSGIKNLMSFLAKFERLKRRFVEIELKALTHLQIRDLIKFMLNGAHGVEDDLIQFLKERTGGIPMYLVEMIRALVANERIIYSHSLDQWQYDVKKIMLQRIKLDSVDLTVSRIQTYSKDDREVLELASIIGMTFQYDLVRMVDEKRSKRNRVRHALQKAIDEGLISRTTDELNLKHLGKAYVFIHPRAREAILDTVEAERKNEVHRETALVLKDSVEHYSDNQSLIFALVNHINLAGETQDDRDLTALGITFNIKAGQAAMQKSSYAQAKGYYERAANFVGKGQGIQIEAKYHTKEKIGDIEAHLRNLPAAAKHYKELLQDGISLGKYAEVALKLHQITYYGGQVTRTLEGLFDSLSYLSLKRPPVQFSYFVKSIFRLIGDLAPVPLRLHRLKKILDSISMKSTQAKELLDEPSFYRNQIYRQLQLIMQREKPLAAFLYNSYLLSYPAPKDVDPESILRSVADRAILMAYFGNTKTSYTLLDLALEKAQSLEAKGTEGYISLYKLMTIDHYRGRYEEFESRARRAIHLLKENREMFHFAIGRVFLVHHDFFRARFDRLTRSLGFLTGPDLPYRNWLNPLGFSSYMFSLYLCDRRGNLVVEGERYLEYLHTVKARRHDPFTLVVQILIQSTKGEFTKAKKLYQRLARIYLAKTPLKHVLKYYAKPFYLPFEEDFLVYFLGVFPDLCYRETGQRFLSQKNTLEVSKRLDQKVRRISMRERSIPKLIRARCEEVLGGKETKSLYDTAIRSAAATGEVLALAMAYYWFGRHLFRIKSTNRINYFAKIHDVAKNHGIDLFTTLAEQAMTEFNLPLEKVEDQSGTDQVAEEINSLPKLSHEHLTQLADTFLANPSPPLQQILDPSLGLLLKHFKAKAFSLFKISSQDKLEPLDQFSTSTLPTHELSSYISPYSSLRSALFLPVSDSPWHKGKERTINDSKLTQDMDDTHLVSSKSESMTGSHAQGFTDGSQPKSDLESFQQATKEQKKRSSAPTPRMNLIIPIPFHQSNVGALFLEKVQISEGDTTFARQDLDYFGAQLGLSLGRDRTQSPLFLSAATYHLEPCPWLHLWSKGSLREGRDSAWYLGVNLGNEDYLLVYSRLNGNETFRKKLSVLLSTQLFALRSMIMASNRISISLIEIKEEVLKILHSYQEFKLLESIAMAFSVFNRQAMQAFSGHIGPSRPIVLGSANEVKPDNHVLFHLHNGRGLRYWGVHGDLKKGRYYILPHDSRQLDAIESVTTTVDENRLSSPKNLEKILEKQLIRDNIPRYYVAATFKTEADLDDTLPHLQKVD